MNPAPDKVSTTCILVVGLGAVGSATLYQLALRGIACHGIDAHHPPARSGFISRPDPDHAAGRRGRRRLRTFGLAFSCHLALTGIPGPNKLAAYLRRIGFWRQA